MTVRKKQRGKLISLGDGIGENFENELLNSSGLDAHAFISCKRPAVSNRMTRRILAGKVYLVDFVKPVREFTVSQLLEGPCSSP